MFSAGDNLYRQRSAACDKLTWAWVSFGEEYAGLKRHFLQNILSDEKSMKQIDIWAKQIEPYIKEADYFYNASILNEANKKATTPTNWNNAVNTLKNQVKLARAQ